MVQTFGGNSANDLYIGSDGNLVVLSGLEAVLDACRTATLAQLGEMVLTDQQGIPNFQTIWIGTPNYKIYQAYLRAAIMSVAGVIEVKSLTLSRTGNTLKYTATIVTEFGTTELSNG